MDNPHQEELQGEPPLDDSRRTWATLYMMKGFQISKLPAVEFEANLSASLINGCEQRLPLHISYASTLKKHLAACEARKPEERKACEFNIDEWLRFGERWASLGQPLMMAEGKAEMLPDLSAARSVCQQTLPKIQQWHAHKHRFFWMN